MSNNAFFNKLNEIRRRIPETIKKLPTIVKVEGLIFIKDNFRNQGFEKKKGQYEKWEKKKKGKKPTLIGEKHGGAMRRSWEGESTTTETSVIFQSSLPYTGVHNDGLMAGRPPGFKMPERPMIGESEALDERIERKLDRIADDIFK